MSRDREVRNGTLLVNGRRRILLGGEVHNSNTSTPDVVETSFRRIAALGADTVLAPVAWDAVEPEQGVFDFETVTHMVRTASALGLSLVPLWFGSWKNGMSSYVPRWIKLDPARFERAIGRNGPVEVLTAFSEANRDADADAFQALMRHLAVVDTEQVVELVQVENEVGLLGSSRDMSPAAVRAWQQSVPSGVIGAVRDATGTRGHRAWVASGHHEAGSWAEVFGDSSAADEVFMAVAYARYVEHVARRGSLELNVPLFVNAWQDSELDVQPSPDADAVVAMAGGDGPGVYPSGGPVRDVLAIWQHFAPSISICAPDIYAKDFDTIARDYRERSGALFIPEMQRTAKGVAQMFRAIGEYGAIGVAPFGADSFADDQESAPLRDAYRMLRSVTRALADSPSSQTRGYHLTEAEPIARTRLAGVELEVSVVDPFGLNAPVYPGYAILIEEGAGRLLVAARGCTVRALEFDGRRPGIMSADELAPDASGALTVVRRLNGDETASGTAVRFAALDHTDPGVFPIPLWNESTGLVRIEYYRGSEVTA